MKFTKLIRLFFGVALLVALTEQVFAQACSSSVSPYATSCDATGITWTTGPLLINSGVNISNTGNFSVANGNTFTNNGNISQTTAGWNGFQVTGNISSFINNGNISTTSFGASGVATNSSITIGSFTNNGVISGGSNGASVNSVITTINNAGTITGTSRGISFSGGTVTTIDNTGTISGGIYNYDSSPFPPLMVSVIGTLINSQGVGNTAGPLTYTGSLPSNYNIIINSPTNYGQLAVTSGTGNTTFGIYSGSTVLNGHVYASVLSGIAASQLGGSGTTINGVSNGISYSLVETGSNTDIWNLDVLSGGLLATPSGPTTADTQASLQNTAQSLQGIYTLQNTVLANSFSYDCNVFGENDVCVSAGGRNTAVSAQNGLNNTSALLIGAYRALANVRIGGYADQNLSVNNAGTGINLGNNTPLLGVFAAWNENTDGTGTEVKVSAAYGQKNTTITRQVVGTSEAGSGSSQLNSQGAQITAKYGFAVADNTLVSPYIGMRYTQNNMGGYSEAATSSVTAPLTYSALNTNATTALAGVGISYQGIPQTHLFASAGVETDTNTSNGALSATGVSGLTPVNFNPNPVTTRPTAMLGASYDIEKNQRIGITGIYRQEAYQATASTTVMATYTVGL